MDAQRSACVRHPFRTARLSLILFDIDGTLLLSGGAGVRAMTRAFEDVFGVPDAFHGIEVAGRTDTFLVSSALARAGLRNSADDHQRFRQVYVSALRTEIQHPGNGRYGIMPGVQRLLEHVNGEPGFHLALLTGNYEPAAFTKLAHFGLRSFFEWGAFGEESEDRNELGRVALQRAKERVVPAVAVSRAIVVGDTPHDIACARAIGARALGVATGSHSVEQLQAAGADIAVASLDDTERMIDFLK